MRPRYLLVPFLALLPLLVVNEPVPAQQGPPPGKGSPCAPGGPPAGYPPRECGLALGKSEARRAEQVPVSGAGCGPNSTVTFTFGSPPVPVGSTQADGTGAFSTTVSVPADATAGNHTIVARCPDPAGQQRALTAVLGVQITRAGGDPLPRTGGASTIPIGIAGAALIGLGTLAVLASRRKRSVN